MKMPMNSTDRRRRLACDTIVNKSEVCQWINHRLDTFAILPVQIYVRMTIAFVVILCSCTPLDLYAVGWQDDESAKPQLNFDDHIKSILTQRCASCHGSSRKESDLDVTNYTALMMGGGSGEVIEPGSADESYLYQLVTHEESPEMPPSGKIPDAEIKLIADWINLGALENAGSKPRKMKPKIDLSLATDANVRPETVAYPMLLPLEPVITPARPSTTALAASPWAQLVAIASPKQVLLYDPESTELLGVLPFEEGVAHRLTFSRNGDLLLGAGGKDGSFGTAVIWDVATGQRLTALGEESDVILAADIRSNHDLIAIGGPAKVVKVLSIADASVRFEITKHTEWITAVEFSPDGKYLATGDRNGGLHVWEVATGAEIFMLSGHSQSITALSWRSDSRVLSSASEDATIRVWEMDKGGSLKNWNAHSGGVTALQFLRDGHLASAGRDQTAKTWKQDGTLIHEFSQLSDVAVAIAFCNESLRLVAADWKGQIKVWNTADVEQVSLLVANPPSISDRIAQAQQTFAELSNRSQPVKDQISRTRDSIESIAARVAENQAERTQTISQMDQLKSQRENTEREFSTLKSEQENLKIESNQLKTSQPLLDAALENLSQALNTMPEDPDLLQAVAALKTKQSGIQARLIAINQQMEGVTSEIDSRQENIGRLDSMLQNLTGMITEIDAQLADLQPQLAPLQETLQQQTEHWEAMNIQLVEVQQEIKRWEQHASFVEELNTLNRQLAETEQSLVAEEEAEEEALKRLNEADNAYRQAQEKTAAISDQAEQIRQRILKLKQPDVPPQVD